MQLAGRDVRCGRSAGIGSRVDSLAHDRQRPRGAAPVRHSHQRHVVLARRDLAGQTGCGHQRFIAAAWFHGRWLKQPTRCRRLSWRTAQVVASPPSVPTPRSFVRPPFSLSPPAQQRRAVSGTRIKPASVRPHARWAEDAMVHLSPATAGDLKMPQGIFR